MLRLIRQAVLGLLVTGVISGGTGCAMLPALGTGETFGMKWPGAKVTPQEGPNNPVVKVLSIWQPASGVDPEGKSARGFAGQIMFFTGKEQAISIVGGGVKIYVFDDQGSVEEQVKPIHIWDFKPEVWKALKVDSQMGPTYQVFIPYTRKGTHEANCSLRLKYEPLTGTPVPSEMVNVTLAGTKKTVVEKPEVGDRFVQQDEEEVEGGIEEEYEEEESPEVKSRAKGRGPRLQAVPLDGAEQERILREFREREEGNLDRNDGNENPETRSRREREHLLEGGGAYGQDEGEDEDAVSPSERFGMRPRIRSGINDWEERAEGKSTNPVREGIRQVAWGSDESETVDQKEPDEVVSPRKKVVRRKSSREKSAGDRRSFHVHSIPLY